MMLCGMVFCVVLLFEGVMVCCIWWFKGEGDMFFVWFFGVVFGEVLLFVMMLMMWVVLVLMVCVVFCWCGYCVFEFLFCWVGVEL